MANARLRDICREVDIYSDDSFVGIRYKRNGIEVVFPMGYEIGEDDDTVRRNILTLLYILSEFTEKAEADNKLQSQLNKSGFPVFSYIYLIRDFLANGLYVEKENNYTTAKRGKINWGKTIKTQKAYPSQGSLVYLDYIVKNSTINQNELITLVHEACLYRCFERIGWLYTSYKPPKPRLEFDKKFFETIVIQGISKTYNDKKRALFGHMLNVIREESNEDLLEDFTYGTYRFEYVWEKMIDHMFGIIDKDKYFPHSNWHILNGNKENSALEPDTIMIKDGIAYILDAKYYRYGVTNQPKHLPATSSISKQIIYAEYIEDKEMTDNDGRKLKTYNAFILPFSKNGKYFKTDRNYKYIGYADADWKSHFDHDYEHVEGILMDINYLMENCSRQKQSDIDELAELIVSSFE